MLVLPGLLVNVLCVYRPPRLPGLVDQPALAVPRVDQLSRGPGALPLTDQRSSVLPLADGTGDLLRTGETRRVREGSRSLVNRVN